jgi:hypothetical protein
MTARHFRCTWQRLLLLLLVIFGIGEIGYWAVFAEGIERPLDSLCAFWDRDASAGVALLIPNATALGQSQLEDALFRLRRARTNCRAGWLDIARQDYLSLRDAHSGGRLSAHAPKARASVERDND